ncbi:uncharacterized protein LOC121726772 [Aricia agestis]|uniref:uncharacterized protein LOC121726772 n=1 Tax=Aricia agestis TaxID=91739 RepID=UPI001C20B1A5|nr:uncharacterized protein LOC121726772 [Aricia agestis]
MNRKRGKRQKNDSGQEILVLPPDLLQKLGINLENICFNEDSNAVPIADISGNEAPLLTEEIVVQDIISTEKNKESSIIETANLMKKSLFLSPTFNTPQSVVVPNSIEPQCTSPEKIYTDNVEVDKNENSEIINKDHCHAVDYCIDNQHIIITQYSQDNQSRSTPILNPISTANEESASQTKIDNKNKINILSEEIVNPTKLSTLRPLIDINDRKALVPIPIDTFISIDKHHQDNKITNNNTCLSHNELKANNSNSLKTEYNEDAVTQYVKTAQTNGEILDNNTTETDIDTEMLPGCNEKSYDTINNLNVFQPAPNVENSGSIEDEDTLKETSNKIRSDQNKLKTVEEKASLEELNTCNASVNENESANTIASILFKHLNKEKNFFTSKQNKAKSKMSVQGVEKPGGEVQINQSRQHKTRTYARNKKNKIANSITFDHVVDIDTNDLKIDYADNISYEHLQIPGQFCICFDFGYLDRDMGLGYAHPHFSNTENNIPLDDALSIYIEDVAINRIDCDNINHKGDNINHEGYNINHEGDNINHDETSDTDNICYNAVYLDSTIENEASDSNNKLIQDNTNTPKTKVTLSKNETRDVASDDNVAQSIEKQRKPAQVSPEVQTIQNMQQHGFDTSNIDTEKNVENQDKLITKKRKLSVLEREESKTDCQKRRKGRRSSRISNEKLEPVSRVDKHKVEVIEKQNSESIGGEESTHNVELEQVVRCAMCDVSVRADRWLSHAAGHAYIAWPHGQTPLDITDKMAIRKHLVDICDELGALTCSKCNTEKKSVKTYLEHTKHCKSANHTSNSPVDSITADGTTTDAANVVPRAVIEAADVKPCAVTDTTDIAPCADIDAADAAQRVVTDEAAVVSSAATDAANVVPGVVTDVADAVRCGVCDARLSRGDWMAHAGQEHNYRAWIHGQPQPDLKDDNAVYNHLYNISKEFDGLTCAKCGIRRKYVKAYLKHIESCKGADTLDTSVNDSLNQSTASLNCTVDEANTNIHQGTVKRTRSSIDKSKSAVKKRKTSIDRNTVEKVNTIVDKDNTTVDKDNNTVDKDNTTVDKDNTTVDKDNTTVDKDNTTVDKDNTTVDKDNTTVDKDNTTVDKDSTTVDKENTTIQKDNTIDAGAVVCGVCGASVASSTWSEHARTQHEYLAWKHGQMPLEISDEEAVLCHLKQILKETGQLICCKCDKICKFAKTYLRHSRKCGASDETLDSSANDTLNVSELSVSKTSNKGRSPAGASGDGRDVTCGVCAASVRGADWSEHARTQHSYLAWKDGETPLDIADEEQVHSHLTRISRKRNGLTCNKCDKTMKYAKSYLSHVKACETTKAADVLDVLECAVCGEKVEPSDWQKHAMSKHYNVAWAVGDTPIDIKNPFAAEKLLNKYKQKHNKLQCKVCKLVRVSCVGFYAHIIQCGKTDEEVEIYKSLCEICNNKYLCVYHSQHMKMHREQENVKQRKLLMAEKVAQLEQQEDTPVVTGRRKAAEKAINVINKSMGGGDAKDADVAGKTGDDPHSDAGTDSDESAQLDSESSESESGVDCDLSDQSGQSGHSALQLAAQNKKRKKKKYPESHTSNIKRIAFVVKDVKAFLAEGVAEIRKKVLCAGELYPQWRHCELTGVPDAHAHLYMPALKRSCNVNINAKEWTTYEMFEARVDKETSFFVGGCIQWISWSPPTVGDKGRGGNYLAVAAHREADVPRLDQSDVFEHPAMLQIWDFGDMTTAPKLSLCIALDCGTLWAGSWCPSGVRDAAAPRARLGLLAVATSSGAAYILPVPYPDDVQRDKLSLYKVKPVAELRFSRGERQKYQATSITWSTEKGHSVVVVGYADGSLGHYNVDSSSPLLSEQDDGVTIFYPYDEEYRHNSCITDVSTVSGGGVCSTSQTGSALRMRGAALRSLLPATCAAPLPLWPATLVVGNDILVNQTVNELECWGAGRRLGPLRCCGGCACCGAVAAVSPPALRLMRLHPAYGDHLKTDIATIQIARLDNKKPKIKNDDLAVVVEPRTYEEAIKTYGVQFKYLTAKHMGGLPSKEQSCERFPLADAVGVAFCPAPAHHTRLAVALHCGLVLVLNV